MPTPNTNITEQEINQLLALKTPPIELLPQEADQWSKLHSLIRTEYLQSNIDQPRAQSIQETFYGLNSFADKEIYLQEYEEHIRQTAPKSPDLTPEEYQQELEKIAEEYGIPKELRDIFYYVHYSEINGDPLDPEIAQIWKEIQENGVEAVMQAYKLSEVMDKRKTLDTRQIDLGEQSTPLTKPGFNQPLTSAHIEQMLNQQNNNQP